MADTVPAARRGRRRLRFGGHNHEVPTLVLDDGAVIDGCLIGRQMDTVTRPI